MKVAVIYARYSSDSQTEQSIDGQLRVCREYAQRNDILIVDTYIDRAMTGTNDNRPDFQRMIKDSSNRQWEIVLVYKLDRFSRNKYETAIHKKTLRDNGVKVVSAMENIPDSPEGIILESLLEGMNQYYSAELAQKVSRGMKETRRKGLYQGGGLLYGYKIDGRKIVIDETTAPIVRYIYTHYAQGETVRTIIDYLTKNNILRNGKPFVLNSIYNILRNEKYSGVYKHADEIIDNMYPQLVSTEIYNQVREKVNANKYGRHSVKTDFLLRKKLICGYCGQPMHGESGSTKNGTRFYYYKCNGRKKRINTCNKSMVRKEIIEDLILNATIKSLSENNIDYIVSRLSELHNKKSKHNSLIPILEKQKKQVESALQNLVSAVEQGIISKTTNQRLHELESQQETIEQQLFTEKNKVSVQISDADIRKYYEQALKKNGKLLITYLIKKVVLFDDKVIIRLNSPLKENPDDDSGFLFYSDIMQMITVQYANTAPGTQSITLEIRV